jgi:prevent-host-death family protein
MSRSDLITGRELGLGIGGLVASGWGLVAGECYDVATDVATKMKTAQVRELKNKTSELLRLAAKEDVIITSRGKPVACLIGIRPEDISIRPQKQVGDYSDESYRKKALRILATFKKSKPDKGKKWIAQEEHDRVLYGDLQE